MFSSSDISSLAYRITESVFANNKLDRYFRQAINNISDIFKNGGFPLVVKEDDVEILDSYFKDILYRDIVARYRLRQVNELKQIGLYFLANSSKIFSYPFLQKI